MEEFDTEYPPEFSQLSGKRSSILLTDRDVALIIGALRYMGAVSHAEMERIKATAIPLNQKDVDKLHSKLDKLSAYFDECISLATAIYEA